MASLKDVAPRYLHTERLTLELFDHTPEQYQCFLDAVNSPTARARLGDLGLRTPQDFDAFTRPDRLRGARFKDGVADDICYYAVRLGPHKPDGELIGGISLSQRVSGATLLPPDPGWSLLEAYHGRGYATEAAREVLRFALEDLGTGGAMVFAHDTNAQSNRVAEKLGFVPYGRFPILDQPGQMASLLVLPGTGAIDIKDGLRLGGDSS